MYQNYCVNMVQMKGLLRFAITPRWQMMGVHHLSQTSNKICHSVCDTHPFKSLIEWGVQKNGLCQIDIAIFGADEGLVENEVNVIVSRVSLLI